MNYSIDLIKNAKNTFSIAEDTSFNQELTLFDETLSMILDEDKAFMVNMINEGAFLDTVKAIDVSGIIEKVLHWFIDTISNISKKFKKLLVSMINKDPRIKMYKKQLLSSNKVVDIDSIAGTMINKATLYGVSNYTDISDIEKEYNSFYDSLSSLKKSTNPVQVATVISNLTNDIMNGDNSIDIIRGRLLGGTTPVSKDEFGTKLYNYFRINKSIFSITVKDEAKLYFEQYKDYTRDVERLEKKFKKSADEVKGKIKKIKIEDYIPHVTLTPEIASSYKKLVNAKCIRIKDICHTYSLYFAAKLEAMLEDYQFSRTVLAKVCLELAEEGGK